MDLGITVQFKAIYLSEDQAEAAHQENCPEPAFSFLQFGHPGGNIVLRRI
jgi:hypothetical protein